MRNTNLQPQVSGLGGFGYQMGRVVLGLALLASLTTCGPGHGTDCLKSTGSIVTHRREVARGIVTVTAYDNVDLRLVQDTATYAEVKCGEHLIDDIVLTRTGNSLDINNTSTCNWTRSYDSPREVTLHLPSVTSVFLRGQGNVSTVGQFRQDTVFFHLVGAGDYDINVRARQLYVDLYELGDVNLHGSAIEMNFTLGGAGRIFGSDLALQRCYFVTTRDSDGDAHVRATDIVAGTISGTGTLYYGGPPAVTGFTITGRGKAKPE